MFTTPFRGSAAVAAGLVTRAQLRGPRFRRLFTDVYVRVDVEVDLVLRARGGYVAVGGVLAGWAAAELLGAADADVEIVRPGGARRSRPGLVVLGDRLAPDEILHARGLPVTSPSTPRGRSPAGRRCSTPSSASTRSRTDSSSSPAQ